MAPQSGGGAFLDAAAVPLADGRADGHPQEVHQADRAAGIYEVNLCKTEKCPSGFDASLVSAFRQYTVRYVRLGDGFYGWYTDQLPLKTP